MEEEAERISRRDAETQSGNAAAAKRECIEAATRAATQGVKLTNEKYANMPIGNTAAMHDALVAVKKLFDGRLMFQPAIRAAHEAVNAALSKPPRNCDMGTAQEQSDRYEAFCDAYLKITGTCDDCPIYKEERKMTGNIPHCQLVWAQMPYEEGGAK